LLSLSGNYPLVIWQRTPLMERFEQDLRRLEKISIDPKAVQICNHFYSIYANSRSHFSSLDGANTIAHSLLEARQIRDGEI